MHLYENTCLRELSDYREDALCFFSNPDRKGQRSVSHECISLPRFRVNPRWFISLDFSSRCAFFISIHTQNVDTVKGLHECWFQMFRLNLVVKRMIWEKGYVPTALLELPLLIRMVMEDSELSTDTDNPMTTNSSARPHSFFHIFNHPFIFLVCDSSNLQL